MLYEVITVSFSDVSFCGKMKLYIPDAVEKLSYTVEGQNQKKSVFQTEEQIYDNRLGSVITSYSIHYTKLYEAAAAAAATRVGRAVVLRA